MKRVGLLLAALATFSMTFLPFTPSWAAGSRSQDVYQRQMLELAKRGGMAILTAAQWEQLANSPKAADKQLYAKLQTARFNHTQPDLTRQERQRVSQLTLSNLREIKAGQAAPKPAEASAQVTVTPKAATTPTEALSACFGAITSATPFGIFGIIVAGAVCLLIFIPLIPFEAIAKFFGALFPPPART